MRKRRVLLGSNASQGWRQLWVEFEDNPDSTKLPEVVYLTIESNKEGGGVESVSTVYIRRNKNEMRGV